MSLMGLRLGICRPLALVVCAWIFTGELNILQRWSVFDTCVTQSWLLLMLWMLNVLPVPESPRFLMISGQQRRGWDLLQHAAKVIHTSCS